MSPLYLYENKLLTADGKLAIDEDCCCGGGSDCPCCDNSYPDPLRVELDGFTYGCNCVNGVWYLPMQPYTGGNACYWGDMVCDPIGVYVQLLCYSTAELTVTVSKSNGTSAEPTTIAAFSFSGDACSLPKTSTYVFYNSGWCGGAGSPSCIVG